MKDYYAELGHTRCREVCLLYALGHPIDITNRMHVIEDWLKAHGYTPVDAAAPRNLRCVDLVDIKDHHARLLGVISASIAAGVGARLARDSFVSMMMQWLAEESL